MSTKASCYIDKFESVESRSTFARKLDVRSLASDKVVLKLCAYKSKIFEIHCHKHIAASKEKRLMPKLLGFENI